MEARRISFGREIFEFPPQSFAYIREMRDHQCIVHQPSKSAAAIGIRSPRCFLVLRCHKGESGSQFRCFGEARLSTASGV
jgi:hypothetical protein